MPWKKERFKKCIYDCYMNAVKEFLFPVLVQNEEVQFTIKRNKNFMCLKTDHLRFLDVTNFLAPGFSYAKFLKAYECPQTKGFFPYEWMDSLDKLDHPSLPPHDAFYFRIYYVFQIKVRSRSTHIIQKL